MSTERLSIDQLITRSRRETEQQNRARKAAARRTSSAQLKKPSPEREFQLLPSSDGSIVNNAGDDGASGDAHPNGRPQSTGALPDTHHRFKDLSIRESRKRPAQEGDTERRDVHPKRETTDPEFYRGHFHNGAKTSLFDLFGPGVNETGKLHSDPSAQTRILKRGSPSTSQDTPKGHTFAANSLGQGQPLESSNTSKWKILLEPETRPISEDQLVKEVRGIYAGLVMVEKKCNEIDQQQAQMIKRHAEEGGELEQLKKEQWQALIAMHRTLLHEHHDFFLASQHPSASPSLKRLPHKYAMPARMWRHGIHSFLEILRQRLPDSLEHMLTFIYLTYSMMTLLVESVPAFEDTWIECLGDLARYRMAVEEANVHDREVWAGVARYWYNKGADRNPRTGRIQHHLAVLARSNILQQLFFYTKSLVCVQPFPNTNDSILQLFNSTHQFEHHRVHPVMTSFTDIHRTLFTCGSVRSFISSVDEFIPFLNNQIGRVGPKWREQGVYIASTNFAAILGYGRAEHPMIKLLREGSQTSNNLQKAQEYWTSTPELDVSRPKMLLSETLTDEVKVALPDVPLFASRFAFHTLDSVTQHTGDKNVIPCVHVSLAFLWSLALVPDSMRYIESDVPWRAITRFLNTLPRQGTSESRIKNDEFPTSGTILPEDYLLRGQIWNEFYYPKQFFDGCSLDIDERPLELPSIAVPRVERCLWLGSRLSTFNRWLVYDSERKVFEPTELALEFENAAKGTCPFGRQPRSSAPEIPKTIKMVDVKPV